MRNRIYKTITGHRGHFKWRDKGREFLQAGACIICSKTLERKTTKSGKPEAWRNFLRRKTCGNDINGKRMECIKKYHEIPENNPMYKGIMHRPCKICGITGLTYCTKDEKLPELCGDCWDNNRPTAYNKKPDITSQCKGCNKEISNRYSNGKLRWGRGTFCSSLCSNRFHFKK